MGCDIHIICEKKVNDKWELSEEKIFTSDFQNEKTDVPFDWRSYGMFGFLADVRNYSHVPYISEQKGLPEDSGYLNQISKYAYETNPMTGEKIPEEERETIRKELINDWSYHSFSYLTLKELLSWNYDDTFEDRRYTKQIAPNAFDGAAVCNEGEGNIRIFKEFLGPAFFRNLEEMKLIGLPEDVRIIFWFDN